MIIVLSRWILRGGEIKVLPTMRKYLQENMPTLFLSLHPFYFENKEKDCNVVIDILSVYPHIYCVDGKKIKLDELFTVLMSSRYCSVIATTKWNFNRRLIYLYRYAIQELINRSKYYLYHPLEIPELIKRNLEKIVKKIGRSPKGHSDAQ